MKAMPSSEGNVVQVSQGTRDFESSRIRAVQGISPSCMLYAKLLLHRVYEDLVVLQSKKTAIRAARVFLQDVSYYQYTGKKNMQFIYHPSKLIGKNQRELHIKKDAGSWIHPLTRLVPWQYMHAILAYAALTETDALTQVGVDSSKWLWVGHLVKDQDVLSTRSETGFPNW